MATYEQANELYDQEDDIYGGEYVSYEQSIDFEGEDPEYIRAEIADFKKAMASFKSPLADYEQKHALFVKDMADLQQKISQQKISQQKISNFEQEIEQKISNFEQEIEQLSKTLEEKYSNYSSKKSKM